MSNTLANSLKETILKEMWDELCSLEGRALDEFLASASLDPAELVRRYDDNAKAAEVSVKRSRFEEAKKRVHAGHANHPFNIVSFDLSKKQKVLAAIKERAAKTNEMTIAARNEKIHAESDVDAFLEACIRLGVIDQDGNILQLED
jgi:carbamoylphosphate synthase small subunit